jgi:hypothetical protein
VATAQQFTQDVMTHHYMQQYAAAGFAREQRDRVERRLP